MLNAAWHVLLQLAPWILLGTLIAGLIHILLPRGFIHRRLQGVGGVLQAVGIGVPLPLCSCGVIPAGIGLKKDGASDGAAVGFLISTPQTGVDSILVSASFLGWPFALFKVVAAAVTGIAGGLLVERGASPVAEDPPMTTANVETARAVHRVRALLDHGLEIIRSIWRWLVVGILASAAITAYVPTDGLAGLGSLGIVVSCLAALAISLPLYVCATASVPIAYALVHSGLPSGAALVFLMAGPATNVATIGAIYRGFGKRVLAIYLATIVVGSCLAAIVFEGLFDVRGDDLPFQTTPFQTNMKSALGQTGDPRPQSRAELGQKIVDLKGKDPLQGNHPGHVMKGDALLAALLANRLAKQFHVVYPP